MHHPLRHRPFLCPYGHDLRGAWAVLVGWQPCQCAPALGSHLGHRTYQCLACAAERVTTACFLPERLGPPPRGEYRPPAG